MFDERIRVAKINFYWDESSFVLGDLFIEEPYRAWGLGTQLLNHVGDVARRLGLKPTAGMVSSEGYLTQEELVSWYERHGFEVV